ncbi:MAG: TetR/AcrR family transcriptional regulator [Eisenbergiella sp.]
MPKAAYSEEDRIRIRSALICTALELMAKQGIQHTTVEQIYKTVGISRPFFYSFFPAKEDIIVEALYLQQPRLIEYARRLISQPGLDWRDAVRQFLHSCCYGEKHGIAV